MAAADPAKGETVFKKCAACHKLDGNDGVGPHLNGVVGRPVASVEGFSYSDGMVAHGGEWTPEELFAFLASPKQDVPGTKMSFAGLPKEEDRANVIAYLQQQGG
jgi:cytochrome c